MEWASKATAPGDFEDSQQPDAAQHGDAQRGHDLHLHQHRLQDPAAHHEAVKAIEERHKIGLQAQAVHLQQHLHREEGEEDLVGDV